MTAMSPGLPHDVMVHRGASELEAKGAGLTSMKVGDEHVFDDYKSTSYVPWRHFGASHVLHFHVPAGHPARHRAN